MEVNIVRPFVRRALQAFYKHDKPEPTLDRNERPQRRQEASNEPRVWPFIFYHFTSFLLFIIFFKAISLVVVDFILKFWLWMRIAIGIKCSKPSLSFYYIGCLIYFLFSSGIWGKGSWCSLSNCHLSDLQKQTSSTL